MTAASDGTRKPASYQPSRVTLPSAGGHVLGLGMSVVPVVNMRPDAKGAETPK